MPGAKRVHFQKHLCNTGAHDGFLWEAAKKAAATAFLLDYVQQPGRSLVRDFIADRQESEVM